MELATLLTEAERVGKWPDGIGVTLIVLIPKPDGGRRPIGLLPLVVRWWMRARLPAAQRWQAMNDHPFFYAGPSRCARVASWKQAARAELAASRARSRRVEEGPDDERPAWAMVLLDLVKAFDHVSHTALMEQARLTAYPAWLIRLSVAAYRAPRCVTNDGLMGPICYARRGITAGSSLATVELRVMLVRALREVTARHPQAPLTVFVDDTSIEGAGTRAQVRSLVIGATLDFVERARALELVFSRTKSLVVASDGRLADQIALAMPEVALVKKMAVKSLGGDIGTGRRRTTRVLQTRLKAFRRRRQCFRRVRRAIGFSGTATVLRTGGTAAMTYATGNMGVSSTMLHSQRTGAAAMLQARGAGDLDLTLVLADASTKGRADPAFAAHEEPIVMWAQAVWSGWLPEAELVDLNADARARLRDQGNMWSLVAGPAAAAVATASRIGWAFDSAEHVVTDQGRRLWLRQDAPAAVQREVREAVRRWRWRRVLTRLPALVPDGIAVAPEHGPFIEPLLHALTRAARGPQWTAEQQGALRAAIIGRHWTQSQKFRIFGADSMVSPNCRLCVEKGLCTDFSEDPQFRGTPMHRIWTCPALAAFRAEHMPEETAAIYERMTRTPLTPAGRLFLTRALGISPRAWVPRQPPEPTLQWVKRPPNPRRAEEVVQVQAHYSDGSMIDSHWQLAGICARRGWAFSWRDRHGRTLALARGRPPAWAPGIHGAELWGLLQCASLSVDNAPFLVDCKAVLLGAQRDLRWARDPARPLARAWIPLHGALEGTRRTVKWMPAHCALEDAGVRTISDGRKLTTADIVANREVDKHAKIAAQADRLDEATVRQVQQTWVDTLAVARWIGVVTVAAQKLDVGADPQRRNGKRLRDSGPGERAPCMRSTGQDANDGGHSAAVGADGDEQTPGKRRRRGPTTHRQHLRDRVVAEEERALAHLLGSRPSGRQPKRSAAEIMAEVTRRVRARGCAEQ